MTWFKSIPGPVFAMDYAIGFVMLILALRFLRSRMDTSRRLPPIPVPDHAPDNILEIAALRGEHNEIVRVILFELYSAGLIEFTRNQDKIDKNSKLRRTAKSPDDVPDLSPQARYALGWFDEKERDPKDIFSNSPLLKMSKTLAISFESRFESLGMVLSHEKRERYTLIIGLALMGYLLPGIIKLCMGVAHHRSIGILVPEMFVGTIVLLSSCYPHRLSFSGRKYLKELSAKYCPTDQTESLKKVTGLMPLSSLILTAGILGIPILAGTAFADFATMFSQGKSLSGGCGGGCGDGCGGGCGGGCGCGGCGGCGCG